MDAVTFTHDQIELVARLSYASPQTLANVLHASGVDYMPNKQNNYYVEKVLRNLDKCRNALKLERLT